MNSPGEPQVAASVLGYVHTTTRVNSSPNSRDSNSLSTFSDLSDPPSFSNSFSQEDDHVDHEIPVLPSPHVANNGPKIGGGMGNHNNRNGNGGARLGDNMNAKLSNVRKSMSSFVTNVSTNVGNAVKNVKENTPKATFVPPQIRLSRKNNNNQSSEAFTLGSLGSDTELRHNGTTGSIATSSTSRPYTAHTATSTEKARATYRKQGLNSFYESLRQRHKEEQELNNKSQGGYSKTASSLMAYYGDLGKGGGDSPQPGNPIHSSTPSIGSHPYHPQHQQPHHHHRPATAISYGSKSTAISGLSYKSSDVESISVCSDPNNRIVGGYATRSKLTLANSIKNKYPTRSLSNNSGGAEHSAAADGTDSTDNGGNNAAPSDGAESPSAIGSQNDTDGEAESRQGTPTSTEKMEQRHEIQATITEGEREDEDEEEDAPTSTPEATPPSSNNRDTRTTPKSTLTKKIESPSTPNSKSPSSTSSYKRNFGDVVDNIVASALKDSPSVNSNVPSSRQASHASSHLSNVAQEEDAVTVATTATSKSRRRKKKAAKKKGQSEFGDIVDGILSSTNE